MKQFRKTIFWCHLIVGTIAGVVILIMSVTGVLLTYEKQITAWADTRGYRSAPESADAPRLMPEALIQKAREAQPHAVPVSITLRSDQSEPAAIGLSGGRTLFVNPYSGRVLGEGSKGVRDFFHLVTDWHRWLGAHGDNRAAARAVTGACNLGFLFIVISGIYLWCPRNLNKYAFRNITWFKRGLSGKARDFNWHNVIGFWSFLPLFIVVISAVVISYAWAGNLVYRIAGEQPPARPAPPQNQRGGDRLEPQFSSVGIDRLWPRAEQQLPTWRTISLRLPNSDEAPLVFSIDRGSGGEPHKRSTLTLNRSTGETIKWEPFSSFSAGRKLRSFLRFAHTGEAAGLIGQTIAGVASLGAVFLVWTGLSLAWRRLRAWQARRQKIPGAVESA